MGKLTQLLLHPDELKAVIQLLGFRKLFHKRDPEKLAPSLNRCYEMLYITSRSFAAVIDELHPELKNCVMIFYLLLRALDTVEDDMTIDPKIKLPWLKNFNNLLNLKEYSYHQVNENERDRVVLVEFTDILTEFHKLKPEYQDVLKDICKQMSEGMSHYIVDEQFNTEGVRTMKDYDLYCHYVAGIVGRGLTQLFVLAGFSDTSVADDNFEKANSMGLFLQKTNIIRDYNEDLADGRSFWPREIWGKYAKNLPDFAQNPNLDEQGVQCINELVLHSLSHVEDVLVYLSLIKDPSSFNFCAIPQVMAIATLDMVYNNPNVLHGNVKIRRGTTCKLILNSRTYPQVVQTFRTYIRSIHHKSNVSDPNYFQIGARCGKIEQFCDLLYPDITSIPKGVDYSNEIRQSVIERTPIDDEISKVIGLETLKCNLSIGVSVLFVSSLVIYVYSLF